MTDRWSLDDLRVFCAVADAGSLTAAGNAVGLSLSLRQVREGQADIGICTPGPAAGDLCTLPFRSDRMVLVVPAAHPWAGRGTIDFQECLWSDHVCLQRSAAMYGFLVQRARDQGRQLKGRIHVAGFDAMARLVGRGVGVGVMPESAARRLEEAQSLSVLVLNDAWAEIPLSVCVRPRWMSCRPPVVRCWPRCSRRGSRQAEGCLRQIRTAGSDRSEE